MRQSTAVNHENEYLMNGILRQMTNIYGNSLNPYMVAKFVGVLLVLKKNGALDDVDGSNPHKVLSNVGNIGLTKDMLSLMLETIDEVKSITKLEKFDDVIGMLQMSEFSESEYIRWFDYFLEELTVKDNQFALYSAPETFATLVDAFLLSEDIKVFNPFGGVMRLTTDMERYSALDACEINHDAWALGMLRVELSGKADKVSYCNQSVDSWTSKIYDAIVAMPPFNAKIQMDQPSPLVHTNSMEEMENVAISRFVESTSPNGCCITFVSPSVMWTSGEKARMREWATKSRYIDTIILLPKNLLASTTIPVVFLVFRKNSLHKDGVRMIDASDLFTNHRYKNHLNIGDIMNAYHKDSEKVSATISFEQIEENDYSWNVADYLNQKEVSCPEGYTAARIEDIIHFPEIKRSTDYHSGNVIQISDLSDDWTRPYVDVDAIDKKNALRGCAMVTEDAILLSTVRTLKPSIVKASPDKPVFVNQNILVAIPNEGIDAEYLCMVLAKTEIPTIGMGAPHISKTRLLRQQIAYPSLEQQRSIYQEARHAAMLEQVKALHLEEVLDRRIAEFSNEIRSRKHDMMPHLRQLSSARKNLWYYLNHKDDFSEEEFLGGMREEVLNQEKAIESLSDLLSIFTRESKFGNPEVVNIDRYLMENYFDGDNYSVDFDTDYKALANYGFDIPDVYLNFDYSQGFKAYHEACPDYVEGINVFIAKDDLKRLCDNIIFNAIKHGFTDSSREDYSIDIQLSVDQERDMFQIDFINNGNPLPKGLDKLRFGLKGEKAGVTAGTGEGGYIVRSIVEHYGGDYDIFSETSGNTSLTTVRVFLPIHRDNEQ